MAVLLLPPPACWDHKHEPLHWLKGISDSEFSCSVFRIMGTWFFSHSHWLKLLFPLVIISPSLLTTRAALRNKYFFFPYSQEVLGHLNPDRRALSFLFKKIKIKRWLAVRPLQLQKRVCTCVSMDRHEGAESYLSVSPGISVGSEILLRR